MSNPRHICFQMSINGTRKIPKGEGLCNPKLKIVQCGNETKGLNI